MSPVAARLRQVLFGSIRRQLILGIALVHAVLMTIFVFDLVERQRDFLHDQAIAQVTSLAETLATNSGSWLLANDVIGLEEVLASQASYPGLEYAMVLGTRGKVMAHTERRHAGQHVIDPVSRELLDSPPGTHRLMETRQLIDVAAPILVNGEHIGWARVALSQQDNLAGLRLITRDGVFYTVIAILIGVLFAVLMARRLTRGLHELVVTSSRVRDGEHGVRAPEQHTEELVQLADDFNRMLDVLEQKEQDLTAAQQELIQSEERFDLAMRGSNDGLWDWDAQTNTVYYSPRWKAMLGFAEDELDNREEAWSNRVHPEDLPRARAAIEANLRGETPFYESVHRIRHRDGSWRWHLERGISVHDDSGRAYRMVGTNTDITERKQAEDALFEEKERALVTLNSIGDAVITTDESGLVVFMNPIAEVLTGWTQAEAAGRTLEEIFPIVNEISREPLDNPVNYCLHEGKVAALTSNTILVNRHGHEIAIEDSAAPIRDRNGRIIGVVMVFHDVTMARELTQKMTWQATHDALTGLVNRAEFERRLAALIRQPGEPGSTHALLYIDLDQFKVVNDTCGHVAGDELLRQLSFLLKEHVRDSDTLARLGGDEFGLLLERCPLGRAREIAESLRHVIKDFRFTWDEKPFEIGASIGVVEVDEDSESLSTVMSAADVACYAAKDLGRNRVHVYEPNDEELKQRRGEMQWIGRINNALANDRLVLYGQAIRPVGGEADEGRHYEILVRMLDEEGELVPPAAFIPAAERYNLMPSVDKWVVNHVCRLAGALRARGGAGQLTMLAINLSGSTLSDDDFLGFVRHQLEAYRVPPELICFEITETAAIANLARAIQFIREMKRLGCRFALDDFGSGLSSFAYLKNLPVDYLKIDGGFIRDMVADPIDRAMVRSINEVGHVMGIQTIAEFVEDEETLAVLRSIGVDYAQGFGIAHPAPLVGQLGLDHGLAPGASVRAAVRRSRATPAPGD